MSGTSVKVFFTNEKERWLVVKVAAQQDMTLPEYVRSCMVQVTQNILDQRAAAAQAQAEAEAKAKVDAAAESKRAEDEAAYKENEAAVAKQVAAAEAAGELPEVPNEAAEEAAALEGDVNPTGEDSSEPEVSNA